MKPKTLSALYKAANTTKEKFLESCRGLDDSEIAEKQIKLLVKVLNGKDQIDMNNIDQRKYYIWFYINIENDKPVFRFNSVNDFYYLVDSVGGPSFLFIREEDARFAGTHWIKLYKRLNKIK